MQRDMLLSLHPVWQGIGVVLVILTVSLGVAIRRRRTGVLTGDHANLRRRHVSLGGYALAILIAGWAMGVVTMPLTGAQPSVTWHAWIGTVVVSFRSGCVLWPSLEAWRSGIEWRTRTARLLRRAGNHVHAVGSVHGTPDAAVAGSEMVWRMLALTMLVLMPCVGRADSTFAAKSVYLGQFRVSFYQAVDECDPALSGSAVAAVRDRGGRTIAKVSRSFHRRLLLEGTGRLRDGRVVNYDTRVNGGTRFKISRAPYGLSTRNLPLVPYRTVAVDTNVIRLGSRVSIPAVRGFRLRDGTTHDGVFVAGDTGSAIRGRHIDIFVGFEDHIRNSLVRSGRIGHGQRVKVFVVPEGNGS
jgi:3D (Asp-Asp-Asp) domain-containing protein